MRLFFIVSFVLSLAASGCGARTALDDLEDIAPDSSVDAPADTSGSSLATRFVDVAAGPKHSCAVTDVGTVYCWGWNGQGELGVGTSDAEGYLPRLVPGINDAVGMSAGTVTCVVRRSGGVLCWGNNESTTLSGDRDATFESPQSMFDITDAVQISVGNGHVCVVTASSEIHCWGQNNCGELGRESADDDFHTLGQVRGLRATSGEGWPDFVPVQVSAGSCHTCARASDGRLACWGANLGGVLGVEGEATPVPQFVRTAAPSNDVAASSGCTCSAGADGTQCWGRSFEGALGHGEAFEFLEPTFVPGIGSSRAVDTNCATTCSSQTDGSVFCWGLGSFGRLGSPADTRDTPPTFHPDVASATKISSGGAHACALLETGDITCWGRGQWAQLGDGSREHYGVTTTLNVRDL